MDSILQDNEIWKDIKRYVGLYQVSNYGRVRSCDRVKSQLSKSGVRIEKKYYGKILSPLDNGNGYLMVGLRDSMRRNYYVHRLVADAFIGSVTHMVVNHKDFDTRNNRVNNLEVITQRENVLYSVSRMCKPNHTRVCSSSGEKYIYVRGYKFAVELYKFGIYKHFNSLQDAVKFRNEVIENEKEYFTK